jgi:Mlc titration factor MtfA (ptsG expression regulator)
MFEFLRRFLLGRDAQSVEIPEALWTEVCAQHEFLAYLTESQRTRLRELSAGFLAAKQFHGAQGFELDDRMMLSIALQACLPVLRLGLGVYSDWVGVIVYRGDFVVPRKTMDEDGVVHEYDDEILGEAWEQGPVIVSWRQGRSRLAGQNVVIHEFAHKLDMSNGGADGLPPLPDDMSREDWSRAFAEAYDDLCDRVDADEPTPIDPYGAEHPAEFFAVASEAFFETPVALQAAYPAVYGQLRQLYGADPAIGEVARAMGGLGEGSVFVMRPRPGKPDRDT